MDSHSPLKSEEPFYRWKHPLERYGTQILRPRERRRPRMPNATSPYGVRSAIMARLFRCLFAPRRIGG